MAMAGSSFAGYTFRHGGALIFMIKLIYFL